MFPLLRILVPAPYRSRGLYKVHTKGNRCMSNGVDWIGIIHAILPFIAPVDGVLLYHLCLYLIDFALGTILSIIIH